MAVKDLSNERRPQVTVPQDQVTVPQDAESQFYISENLPPPGKHFDDPKETVDTYTAKTAPNLEKDAKKLPNVAENINIILANKFADRNHYVRIDYVGCKLFYFLKWKNGKAAQKPVKLFEFDELNLPVETKEFLAFKIKQKAVTLEDNGKIRKIVLKDTDDKTMGPVRYLIIPVNPHESYTNDNGVVNGDAYGYDLYILAGEKGVKERTTTQVNNGGADKTTLYTLDIWPAGKYENPTPEKPVVVEKKPIDPTKLTYPSPTTKKIVVKDTPKLKIPPTPPQGFAKKVIDRVTKDGVPENLKIVLAIDNTGSMQIAVLEVIKNIYTILKHLEEQGVKKFSVGIVTFRDEAEVEVVMPMKDMNKQGVISIFNHLGQIQVGGGGDGPEAVGEGIAKSAKMFSNEVSANKVIFVLTDTNALGNGEYSTAHGMSIATAKALCKKNDIGVEIEVMSEKYVFGKYYGSLKAAAEVNKALFLEDDKDKLLKLAKYDPNGYARLYAAEALVKIGEPEAAKKAFIDIAKNAPNEDTRRSAANKILAKIGGKDIILDIAKNDPKWEARLSAAEALVEIGEIEAAKEVFLDIAKNDPKWEARLSAAEALVKTGEIEAAKEVFLDIAKNNPDGYARRSAAAALVKIGELEAAKEVFLDLAKNDPSLYATEALVEIGEIEALLDIAKNDPDWSARLHAAEGVLVKTGKTEALKEIFLDIAKKTYNWYVHRNAINTLVKIGETEAAKEILIYTTKNSPNWKIRLHAAETLVEIGETEAAKKALLYIAKNIPGLDSFLYQDVLEAFAKLVGKEMLLDLAKNDPDWNVRLYAAKALAEIDETEAAKEVFLNIAKNAPDYSLRVDASFYLISLGEPEGWVIYRSLTSLPIKLSWPAHLQYSGYFLSSDGWSSVPGNGIALLLSIPLDLLTNLSFPPPYSQLENGYQFFGNIGYNYFDGTIDSTTQYASHSFEIGPELRFVPFGETPIILSTSLLLGKGTNSKKLSKGNFKPTSSGFTYGAKASLTLYGLGIGAKYDGYLDKFFYSFDIDIATMLGWVAY